jgi:hypothetical protein
MRQMRNSVLLFGAIGCACYIVFMLIMRAANLLHVTELRWVNYVILCLLCIVEIKRWVTRTGKFVPFLQVFSVSFFTGIFSFLLFSIFIDIYSAFDPQMKQILAENVPHAFEYLPSTVLFLEGSAISIITALICLQYFRRYEEGEVEPHKSGVSGTTVVKHKD